jgi:hypothetical protein
MDNAIATLVHEIEQARAILELYAVEPKASCPDWSGIRPPPYR